jgi:hypothetical protein
MSINTNFKIYDPTNFNHFTNLDSVETRIIEYIRDSQRDEAQRVWKLLKYNDTRALFQNNLTPKEKNDLIYLDQEQEKCRVFNFHYIEDEFVEMCSLIKVYIHSIEPVNHLVSRINVGIDILTHNKLTNVYNDNGDVLEGGRPVEENIPVKNRNTVILQALLSLLNGAIVEGVGVLQFNMEMTKKCNAEMKLTNNKNFYGYSLVLSCEMSAVGVAVNG